MVLRDPSHGIKVILKTSLLRIHSVTVRSRPSPIVRQFQKERAPIRLPEGSRPNELLLYDVRQHASFPEYPAECANSGSHGREGCSRARHLHMK
jgi:hypothetical protein